MRLEVVTRIERLAEVAGDWNALLSRCHDPHPTLAPSWLLAWWSVFGGDGSGRELRSALYWAGDRLVGVVPLLARRVRVNLVLPRRRLELLASGEDDDEDERDEICPATIGAVADPAFERPVASALANALIDGALGPWDDLVMPQMDASRAVPALLTEALSAHARVALRESGSCPYVSLPGSWEEYLRALGDRKRELVRRSLGDLETWAGDSLTLRCAETPDEFVHGRQVLESLHAQRWNTIGEPSPFDSDRVRAFRERAMADLFGRGELELLWLEAQGQPLAASYNVVHAGRVYCHQGAGRMDLPGHIRLGTAFHAYAIRRAIENGRREYDFLARRARDRLDLATAARPLCTLHAWAGTLTPHLDAVTRQGFALARRLGTQARALLGLHSTGSPSSSRQSRSGAQVTW